MAGLFGGLFGPRALAEAEPGTVYRAARAVVLLADDRCPARALGETDLDLVHEAKQYTENYKGTWWENHEQ